jgi:hypothetical protein
MATRGRKDGQWLNRRFLVYLWRCNQLSQGQAAGHYDDALQKVLGGRRAFEI